MWKTRLREVRRFPTAVCSCERIISLSLSLCFDKEAVWQRRFGGGGGDGDGRISASPGCRFPEEG